MVNLADAIQFMFPHAITLVDYEIADTGGGPYIARWNSNLGQQPTIEEVASVTPALHIQKLRRQIAAYRWGRETMGIVIGSQNISTHRDETGLWLGMVDDMQRRPGATAAFEYRPRDGFNVILTPTQVLRVVDVFKWYVAACFATERALNDAITAAEVDLATIAAIAENPTTWPQRQFDWTPPT